jgi:outer membrane protein assembly factor BamA
MGALAGARLFLGSVEVRYDLLNAGDFGAVTLLGFLDYGNVKDDAATNPETGRFGGGGGVAVRILRSAVLTMNFAGGNNGFNFSMGTGWSF